MENFGSDIRVCRLAGSLFLVRAVYVFLSPHSGNTQTIGPKFDIDAEDQVGQTAKSADAYVFRRMIAKPGYPAKDFQSMLGSVVSHAFSRFILGS